MTTDDWNGGEVEDIGWGMGFKHGLMMLGVSLLGLMILILPIAYIVYKLF
jgi:hypothetical protein